PGTQHEQRRSEQEVPLVEAIAPGAHGQGGQSRPEQGGGAQNAYLQCSEAKRQQIRRQEHGDIAVSKRPQRLAHQEGQDKAVNAIRQQQTTNHLRPRSRPIFFSGVSAHQAYSASEITMSWASISWSSAKLR